MPGGSPWPDAPPARAEIFIPTRARPEGLDLVRSRRRRDPCARDRRPRDARRRPPTPVGRSPPSRHVAASPGAGGAAGRRESQSEAVAHGAVPRTGVRDGVRPLRVLLPWAGLLWGSLPRDRATAPTAARDRQASAQPGRPARSPGPPTGLPRAPSPPRDGCTFPRAPSIHDHRTPSRALDPPARLPRLWARVA